jgi:two-component system, NtrC family, sensor kinase
MSSDSRPVALPAILYIDDDVANLTVLEAVCSEEFVVLTASSGAAGLALLRDREVGVLLVDQRMPGMTGVEVLEAARGVAPDAVRILITAYSDLGEAISAINRGRVERYLRKPWEPAELRATLRDALALYDLRRRLQRLELRLRETERVYALGVVAASVAHELRNPLGVLMPSLDLAKSHLQRIEECMRSGRHAEIAEPARKLGELLVSSTTAAEQMHEITRGMELGQRRRGARRQCDLREVISLTLRILRTETLSRARIVVEEVDVPQVRGSATQIGQVALNLIVNALQAFESGAADQHLVTVRVRPGDDGRAVILEVEDNGPGIPDDALAKIFDPFYSTKEEGGTGLGLAISRRIVEEVGGTLAVRSTVGQGTCFTVSLPVA